MLSRYPLFVAAALFLALITTSGKIFEITVNNCDGSAVFIIY
jgi:hypothetical protein